MGKWKAILPTHWLHFVGNYPYHYYDDDNCGMRLYLEDGFYSDRWIHGANLVSFPGSQIPRKREKIGHVNYGKLIETLISPTVKIT